MLREITPEDHLVVARTVRTRFVSIPGRSGQPRWPTGIANSAQLAVGPGVRTGTRTTPGPSAGPRVAHSTAAGAPQTIEGRH